MPSSASTDPTDAAISAPVFSSCRRRRSRSRSGHVEELAADHALSAGCRHELAHGRDHVRRLALLQVEREAQRLREQSVAREDRHVLAERDVAGRLAAAELVVVHRREVVVDQRVGVDHLDRRGERKHLVRGATERLGGREREHRPDALAAGEQRVAHGLLEAGGAGLGGEAQALEIRSRPSPGARPDSPQARSFDSAQRRRSWPSDSAAPRARASISAPSRAAISAQRSTRSAASSASTASARSLSATASSSSARAVERVGRAHATAPFSLCTAPRTPLMNPGRRRRTAPSRPRPPRRSRPRPGRPAGCAARGPPRAGCCAPAARSGRATSRSRVARSTRPARRARASTPSTSSRVNGVASRSTSSGAGRPVTSDW